MCIRDRFLDTDSILFENIKNCIGTPVEGWKELYVGIDWGSGAGGDYTSMCGINEKGQMVFIDYFNDKSTFEQAKYIKDVLDRYRGKVRKVQAESNSIGAPMIELLKKTLEGVGMVDVSRRVTPFTTTNAEKVRLVNALQVALEQSQITLLDDKGLITQLSAYEAQYNPKTNNVSYNAPQGMHDDNCISTMLAWDAYQSTMRFGKYNISIR